MYANKIWEEIVIISRVFFCFDPLFSIDVDGADIRLIHFIDIQDKQWFEDRRGEDQHMIVHMERRSKIVFFFLFSLFFFFLSSLPRRTVAGGFARGERKARTKERKGKDAPFERNSLSWLHAVRISLQRRIIQIIASEMIISDDHATVDLAALKWHARVSPSYFRFNKQYIFHALSEGLS